jgi:hypothetical protein
MPLFEDRTDAVKQLAKRVQESLNKNMAIYGQKQTKQREPGKKFNYNNYDIIRRRCYWWWWNLNLMK